MNGVSFYRGFFQGNMLALIGVLLCFYFSYHAISGQRSLFRLVALENTILSYDANKDNVIVKRQYLEGKVHMMRPGAVDRDLLEERVRLTLGYKESGEVSIMGL